MKEANKDNLMRRIIKGLRRLLPFRGILNLHPNFYCWLKLLGKFMSAQIVIQVITALSGILIIRTLSKQEYAYFTIANSLQSTMNVLSNSGLTSGLLVIGGTMYQDSYEMGRLTNTILRLRFFFALIVVPIFTIILALLLINAGAKTFHTIFIVIAILVELLFYFYIAIFETHLQLHSLFNKIQKNNIIVDFTRLSLLLITCKTILNAAVASLISTVASGFKFWLLKSSTVNLFEAQASVKSKYKKELKSLLMSHLPIAIFYVFQGQLTIWLITIFGTTSNIAEVGALSRLGTMFALLSSLVPNIITPMFAKSSSIILLRKKYFLVLIIAISIIFILLFTIYLFPNIFLWILGNNYSQLTWELFLIVLSQSIVFLGSIIYSLNYSRGWIQYLWVNIPLTLFFQSFILFSLNLAETKDVILFGILSQLPGLFVNFYLNYLGLSQKLKHGG